jgi:hypothetical protein
MISFLSGKMRFNIFFQFNVLYIFGTRLVPLKSLKAIISSGEVSEGTIVLGVDNESSAERGNTF